MTKRLTTTEAETELFAVPSSSAITVRSQLEPGDLGAIVRLHGLEAAGDRLDQTFEAEVARGLGDLAIAWTRSPDAGRLWLAGPASEPLATIAITRERPDLARLRWFLVAPAARGLGLGRQLLDNALAYARAHGLSAVELGTFAELTVAAAMYRRAGFDLVESAHVEQSDRRYLRISRRRPHKSLQPEKCWREPSSTIPLQIHTA
jgi:GNAT superfamily N-acetyltransferase